MIVTMIKSPRDNGKTKVEHLYTGPQDTEVVEGMIECDSEVSAHGYDKDISQHCYVSCFFCFKLKKNWYQIKRQTSKM